MSGLATISEGWKYLLVLAKGHSPQEGRGLELHPASQPQVLNPTKANKCGKVDVVGDEGTPILEGTLVLIQTAKENIYAISKTWVPKTT